MTNRWVADATGRHLGSADPFSAEDLFPVEQTGPETPEQASWGRFQFLKKGDRVRVGKKDWIVVKDLGGREKLFGEPDYFDVNDPPLFIARCEDPAAGVVEVSKASKRGEYRPVGKPVAKGLVG